MDIYNALFVSVRGDEYEPIEIETRKFLDLPEVDLKSILLYILRNLKDKKAILNSEGFYSLDEIKEKKGLKFTNKDEIFFRRNYSFESLSLTKKISDYDLEGLSDFKKVFVQVEMPKEIKDQLEVFEQKKKEKKKQSEEAKKKREIEKAKKLLEKHGEN
jgi:hypothetical protein